MIRDSFCHKSVKKSGGGNNNWNFTVREINFSTRFKPHYLMQQTLSYVQKTWNPILEHLPKTHHSLHLDVIEKEIITHTIPTLLWSKIELYTFHFQHLNDTKHHTIYTPWCDRKKKLIHHTIPTLVWSKIELCIFHFKHLDDTKIYTIH